MVKEFEAGKVVLFLGAGSSLFAGYRTFQSFPDLIFNNKLRAQGGLPAIDDEVLRLLENIKQVLRIYDKPLTHDNFMWILDGYNQMLRNLRIDNELKYRFVSRTLQSSEFSFFDTIVKRAIELIIETTFRHYSTNLVTNAKESNPLLLNEMEQVYQFYTRLALFNNSQKPLLRVFTTNYDMLLEDMHAHFCCAPDPAAAPFRSVSYRILAHLQAGIRTCFDREELKTLCFELGLPYDDLYGENLSGKARELVDRMEREGRIEELTLALKNARPHVVWDVDLQEPNPPGPASQLTEIDMRRYLREHPLPLVNGFCDLLEEGGRWDKSLYNTNQESRGLFLYRLHGNVCWSWHDFGDSNVYFHRAAAYRDDYNRICAMYPGHERLPGMDPHKFGFHEFYRSISQCRLLVFLGYSFRDDNVMQLVLSANARRHNPLHILLVDPNMRKDPLITTLSESAKRSPFPTHLPKGENLTISPVTFGSDHAAQTILATISHLLEK